MRGRATLVWTLVIAVSCRSAAPRLVDAPPLLPPAPHRRPYTHRDSLALAELDEYIRTLLLKGRCPGPVPPDEMPIYRGDTSNDTLMVAHRRPTRPRLVPDLPDSARRSLRCIAQPQQAVDE